MHQPVTERHSAADFIGQWPLFEFPWFRRTWVVQEVFNARSALVYCGTEVLSWPTILRVNRCIGLHGMMANLAHKAFMPPIFDSLFNSMVESGTERLSDTDILDALIKGLDLDATDLRDKVFAMLQFGRGTNRLDRLPKDVAVDYTRPPRRCLRGSPNGGSWSTRA